ncbi:MAG: hypothetical protein RL417_1328 [Pseudomonadota bacterium]|jgi:hypothetical protein
MSDFSFDRLPSRKDFSADLGGQSFPQLRPLDDSLLRSVVALSAPNPSFQTLVGVVHGLGLSSPGPELTELWKWVTTTPHHRELVYFPSDRQLQDLATRLDSRITLFREADESKVGYTFQIQPFDEQFRGVVFSFSNRVEVLNPSGRSDSSELSIHALPNMGPESQVAALREALRILGVTRAAQVEREGTLSFGRPSPDTGLDRINFMRQAGGYLADLGEQYRIGRMTKCIMCEGIGKSDFEYVLSLGAREFQRETAQKLWERWLVMRPHQADQAIAPTDRELRSAARQVSGLVGLMREATAEGVTYGLQTVLLSDSLNGLRLVVTTPSPETRARYLDGVVPGEHTQERMLMRVLGAPGILSACRARVMTRVLKGIAPDFRPATNEQLPDIVDLGRSPILCSRNVRLFLDPNA